LPVAKSGHPESDDEDLSLRFFCLLPVAYCLCRVSNLQLVKIYLRKGRYRKKTGYSKKENGQKPLFMKKWIWDKKFSIVTLIIH